MSGGPVEQDPPELAFAVEGVEAVRGAAAPALRLRVAVDAGVRAVRGMGLRVRVRIRAERRRHDGREAERLGELFGAPADWARSLRPVPWTEATVQVGPFEGRRLVEVPVPCTYDFDVAAAKYLAALEGGDVPLELLFGGNVLWREPDGRLQTAMIPWDREAAVRMPLAVWRDAMAAAFGDTAWLRVDRRLLARLQAERSSRGATSWDDLLEALLAEAGR